MHEIFYSWQIMKAIDTGKCGGLNLNGVDTFHGIQENLKPCEQGMIYTSSTVQREGTQLEAHADSIIPPEFVDSNNCEQIRFKFDNVIWLMLDTIGLTEVAVQYPLVCLWMELSCAMELATLLQG